MKRILITGANSYIGTSFEKWMEQFGSEYHIDTLDMHGESWKKKNFSVYDSIFHVAGIAHSDVSRVDNEIKKLYYQINCDLTLDVAKKYIRDLDGKSGQFIYMSSIIIYGEGSSVLKKRVITPDTAPNPSNFYGDSKWQAEVKLNELEAENFKIAILRPPMIYGEGAKGNYRLLVKIAQITWFFPDIKNERSMLNIITLNKYIKDLIDYKKKGIFFPQEKEYIRTSHLVKEIAKNNGKSLRLFTGLNWVIYILGFFPGKIGRLVNKAFGNLVYSR
ncbi:NAD-dependent epimerase/dehydratase family protein [Enterococcus sp. N342-3-1-2]